MKETVWPALPQLLEPNHAERIRTLTGRCHDLPQASGRFLRLADALALALAGLRHPHGKMAMQT
jgi:hypothetical protein